MKKLDQDNFYNMIGRRLTAARESRNITITEVSNLSGEQFNTIRAIEEGKRFSAHHFIWMKDIFNLDFNGERHDKTREGLNKFI